MLPGKVSDCRCYYVFIDYFNELNTVHQTKFSNYVYVQYFQEVVMWCELIFYQTFKPFFCRLRCFLLFLTNITKLNKKTPVRVWCHSSDRMVWKSQFLVISHQWKAPGRHLESNTVTFQEKFDISPENLLLFCD